ncbi:restriction endonuclease subunit S [Bacteroides thetaiotaomicron]|uniref:restriction endonuclease subunit S n=1 Tax=Bacteroides thetaiotaomicron TaxID=818 RepID=UPI0039C02BBD
MPHYEQVPFEVPGSWVWCTLGDLAFYKKGPFGSSLTKAMFVPKSNDTYKVYEQKNAIQKDNTLGSYFITKEKYDSLIGFAIQPYDIIVSCAGTIGETYVLPQNSQEGIINQALMLIRLYSREIEQFYLLYFDFILKEEAYKESKGTAIKNIPPFDVLKGFHIPLPPISEQQRILKEIEHWFSLIDIIERGKDDLQTTIKQAKSKILDLAIHGKLVPQDPNDEPASELLKRINPKAEVTCDNGHSRKLPQGWYSVTANDVCSIIGGVSYNKADIQDTGIRVLRGGNIQNGKVIDCFDDVFISLSYQNNDNQVQRGDIIVVASTGSQTLIGKTGFADRDIPKTQIGAFLRIVRPKQKTLSPYIRLIFQTDAYKDYIRNVAKGSNINNVKNAHLQNFQICLPPLEEQQRIVQKIEELFSSLDDILTALEV